MKEYKNDFIVCKNLVRPCILGADFLRKHGIWTGWSPTGKVQLISQQKFLVESLEVLMKGPMIHNKQGIESINNLQVQLVQINQSLMTTMKAVQFLRYTVAVITDVRIILSKLTLGVMGLQQNVKAIYEYLRVLSSKQVNPLLIPPDALREVLAHIKDDMKRNPRLQLPEDPNVNIWNYYSIKKITPVVMYDFLLIILTIPLTDQSLEMNLYRVYNLPALHPELRVELPMSLKGNT